jgi:hypothetical protein
MPGAFALGGDDRRIKAPRIFFIPDFIPYLSPKKCGSLVFSSPDLTTPVFRVNVFWKSGMVVQNSVDYGEDF